MPLETSVVEIPGKNMDNTRLGPNPDGASDDQHGNLNQNQEPTSPRSISKVPEAIDETDIRQQESAPSSQQDETNRVESAGIPSNAEASISNDETLPPSDGHTNRHHSIIEISDDDADTESRVNISDYRREDDSNDVIVINDTNDNDNDNDMNDNDIQITGSNTIEPLLIPVPVNEESNDVPTRGHIRPGSPIEYIQGRNVRRRLSNHSDDEIEITGQRPARQALRYLPQVENPPILSDGEIFRQSIMRQIETPLGIFEDDDPYFSRPREREQPAPNPAFIRFQFGQGNNRGRNSLRGRGRGTRGRGVRGRNTSTLHSRRFNRANENQYEQFQLPDMILEELSNQIEFPLILPYAHTHRSLEGGLMIFRDSDQVEGSIMERIERDNETAMDRRLQSENTYNKKALEDKKLVAKNELKGYSNNIKPDENGMCELCGITLGEGIPEAFKPNPQWDLKLAEFSKNSHVQAPWFCIKQCFETDRTLLKRVFTSKCGHLFCGRCVKNIVNKDRGNGRKNKRSDITIDNPLITAPRKCPAEDCGRQFVKGGKNNFQELYL